MRNVSGRADFDAAINVPNLVVVDFYGDWCGPCKMIAPVVEEYSRKYADVVFLKVQDQQCPVGFIFWFAYACQSNHSPHTRTC